MTPVDRDVPLSTNWRGVYRSLGVDVPDETPCLADRAWCPGPAAGDTGRCDDRACERCAAFLARGDS